MRSWPLLGLWLRLRLDEAPRAAPAWTSFASLFFGGAGATVTGAARSCCNCIAAVALVVATATLAGECPAGAGCADEGFAEALWAGDGARAVGAGDGDDDDDREEVDEADDERKADGEREREREAGRLDRLLSCCCFVTVASAAGGRVAGTAEGPSEERAVALAERDDGGRPRSGGDAWPWAELPRARAVGEWDVWGDRPRRRDAGVTGERERRGHSLESRRRRSAETGRSPAAGVTAGLPRLDSAALLSPRRAPCLSGRPPPASSCRRGIGDLERRVIGDCSSCRRDGDDGRCAAALPRCTPAAWPSWL